MARENVSRIGVIGGGLIGRHRYIGTIFVVVLIISLLLLVVLVLLVLLVLLLLIDCLWLA